jgi:hypothetical protein
MGDIVDVARPQCGDRQVGAHGHEFQFHAFASEDALMDAEV